MLLRWAFVRAHGMVLSSNQPPLVVWSGRQTRRINLDDLHAETAISGSSQTTNWQLC